MLQQNSARNDFQRKVKARFLGALRLEGSARNVYLESTCGRDTELEREVRSLLAAAETPSAALTSPLAFSLDQHTDRRGRVGPYRILHLLGEGGSAMVYRAHQEGPLPRDVAIKILKPGLDSSAILARFETEKRTLSRMNHPHIAQVFDAGSTERGYPYFAMELVDGLPITTYCERRELPTRRRLELFQGVCAGVQHAHAKGVLHRDIKPSNILVADGEPRARAQVIDFGIAKVMHAMPDSRQDLTRQGELLGTPRYISPEQADPDCTDVDIRSDVYSLGVVLGEVLDLERDSGSRQGRAERSASSELVWMQRKATERDRERRYQTVLELQDDIDRHLRGEPVAAGPPSRIYLLRKFVRRNKLAVSAAVAVTLALWLGAGLAVFGLLEANEKRDRAQAAQREAEALSGLVEKILMGVHASTADDDAALLEVIEDAERSIPIEFADAPLAEARLRTAIGVASLGLRRLDEAQDHFSQALPILDELLGESHPRTLKVLMLLGETQRFQREESGAIETFGEVQRRAPGGESGARSRASAHISEGATLCFGGRYRAALESLHRALDLVDRYGLDDEARLECATWLSSCYHHLEEYRKALPHFEECYRLALSLHGEHDFRALTNGANLANCLIELGEPERSLALLRTCSASASAELAADHYLHGLFSSHSGEALRALKRYDESEAALRGAYDHLLSTRGPDEPLLHGTVRSMVRLLQDLGRAEAAAEWATKLPAEPAGPLDAAAYRRSGAGH